VTRHEFANGCASSSQSRRNNDGYTEPMLLLSPRRLETSEILRLRALETLREADVIASEDTRKTGLMLKHFEISKPQISFHEHNEERASERIMALLADGKSVALVTNAGTPGISTPGTGSCAGPSRRKSNSR